MSKNEQEERTPIPKFQRWNKEEGHKRKMNL
jgi:hypothetical protein